jgi:hypothetical protein
MPAVTADILYLAYRLLFVLIGRATAAAAALRLRSPGYRCSDECGATRWWRP